ncbi:hypothetical protein [Actinocorallia lasiicapitis]
MVWFDPVWFPELAGLDAELGASGWQARLITPDGPIDLDDVTAVYYGHSRGYGFPSGMSEPEMRFALIETRFGLGGLLADLPVRWVSHPSAVADAEYRIRQMAEAARCGLILPRSIVTTDSERARAFLDEQPTVYKTIMHKVVAEQDLIKLVYTTPVTADQVDDRVALAPHLFQANVPKVFDVRVVVTLTACAGASIHSDDPGARQDWRTDYDSLTYRPCRPPDDVVRGCQSLLSSLGLRAGVFDFSVDVSGVWWFLEVGPTARWAWLESAAGLDLAKLFADELLGG